MTKRIHVIINPAAGAAEPILYVLNRVFGEAGVTWDVSLTQQIGDGRRLAQEAVEAGAHVVAVYGGDGTVADVGSGLIHTDVPLAILPGGTANVFSYELNIPQDLAQACAVIVDAPQVRDVDIGRIEDRHFALRVGVGFEAAMVEGAERDLKARLGSFAYGLAALQALAEPKVAQYRITLDDKEVEAKGLTCLVANSGQMGMTGLKIAPEIRIDDGLLDVVVVRSADIGSLLSLLSSVAGFEELDIAGEIPDRESEKRLQHWQARNITIDAEPAQTVQVDGEILRAMPISIEVIPQALRVITPLPPAE